MRLKKRQEYLDSLLDREDVKRLKKATEALEKGEVIPLEEIKKDFKLIKIFQIISYGRVRHYNNGR